LPISLRAQAEAAPRGPRAARPPRRPRRLGPVRRARLPPDRSQAEDAGEPDPARQARLTRGGASAMSLSGNLEDVSVADALQFIHLGGRTGTLTLTRGEVTAEIGFHQGRIVNAWGPASKRLGDLLVDSGSLSPETLEGALRTQESERPRRSLGQILVAMNALSPEAMYTAVQQQIERTVYDLVTWTSGTFHFALDDLKPMDDI